jgi:hypothetical protein
MLWEYTIDLVAPGGRVVGAAPVLPPNSGALPMEFPIINHRYTVRMSVSLVRPCCMC